MPRALQSICGFFTAGAAGTGVATPMSGDTFTVQAFTNGGARIVSVWAEGASTDFVRIRSPRMHDANQGVRLQVAGITNVPLTPYDMPMPLFSVDTPIVEIDETAAATGAISCTYDYDDLGGVNPRLAAWSDISPRILAIAGVQVNLGAIAAIGQYSAGVAINANFDNFEAGADYAILGIIPSSGVLEVAVSGQDTGNLKIGVPGIADPRTNADYFIRLSERCGRPCIPIIAANNKGSTLVFQTDNTAHAAQNVSLIMAELR